MTAAAEGTPGTGYLGHLLILLGLSCVFFVLGNNVLGLTNPDEVFYAQTAREMVQHHSWATPYLFGVPQFEKPILLYWLLNVSVALFGPSAFAWRFVPAVFAAAGITAVYFLASLMFRDTRKGLLSAVVLASSGLYIGLARTLYTDMVFSVFILLALASFWMGYVDVKRRGLGFVLFFAFAALAVLTKGPLGLILPGLTAFVFLAARRELRALGHKGALAGLLVFLVLAVPWYALMVKTYGRAFTGEFFYNDHIRRILAAEHQRNDTWYFYPLSSLVSMFPWTIFVAVSFGSLVARLVRRTFEPSHLFLSSWIVVTLVVFLSAHSKLVSYVFPMFPALAMLTGDSLYGWAASKSRSVARWLAAGFVVMALFPPAGLAVAAVRFPEYLPPAPWVYCLAVLMAVLSAAVIVLAARRRFVTCVYVMSPVLIVAFYFGLTSEPVDFRLSSRNACHYLSEYDTGTGTVLCSKYFVRAVYYYTGRNVAVADIDGIPFFSPHPIPFLDTEEKVRTFLLQQRETYCVVDGSTLSDLRRISANGMTLVVLAKSGNEYVARILAD